MRGRLWTKCLVLPAALAALLLAAAPALAAEAQQNVKLAWGFIRRTGEGSAVSESPTRKVALPSGTSFRFYYKALSPQYLYLLLDDAAQTLTLIRPATPGRSARVEPGAPEYVPGGSDWFTLDPNPGTETFLLLVSDTPLEALDTLLKDMPKGGAKGPARDAILNEITALKRSKSALTSAAEKPVPIAGTMRGAAPIAPGLEAVEVSAERFYTRTLRIEHQ